MTNSLYMGLSLGLSHWGNNSRLMVLEKRVRREALGPQRDEVNRWLGDRVRREALGPQRDEVNRWLEETAQWGAVWFAFLAIFSGYGITEDDMSGAWGTYGTREFRNGFWYENLKNRGRLKDLGLEGRKILKFILNKWKGLNWINLAQDRNKWRGLLRR